MDSMYDPGTGAKPLSLRTGYFRHTSMQRGRREPERNRYAPYRRSTLPPDWQLARNLAGT